MSGLKSDSNTGTWPWTARLCSEILQWSWIKTILPKFLYAWLQLFSPRGLNNQLLGLGLGWGWGRLGQLCSRIINSNCILYLLWLSWWSVKCDKYGPKKSGKGQTLFHTTNCRNSVDVKRASCVLVLSLLIRLWFTQPEQRWCHHSIHKILTPASDLPSLYLTGICSEWPPVFTLDYVIYSNADRVLALQFVLATLVQPAHLHRCHTASLADALTALILCGLKNKARRRGRRFSGSDSQAAISECLSAREAVCLTVDIWAASLTTVNVLHLVTRPPMLCLVAKQASSSVLVL